MTWFLFADGDIAAHPFHEQVFGTADLFDPVFTFCFISGMPEVAIVPGPGPGCFASPQEGQVFEEEVSGPGLLVRHKIIDLSNEINACPGTDRVFIFEESALRSLAALFVAFNFLQYVMLWFLFANGDIATHPFHEQVG